MLSLTGRIGQWYILYIFIHKYTLYSIYYTCSTSQKFGHIFPFCPWPRELGVLRVLQHPLLTPREFNCNSWLWPVAIGIMRLRLLPVVHVYYVLKLNLQAANLRSLAHHTHCTVSHRASVMNLNSISPRHNILHPPFLTWRLNIIILTAYQSKWN